MTPSCAVLDLPGGLLASPRSIFSFAWDHLRLILGLLKASWSPLGSCRGAFGISWALLKIHLDSSSVSRPTIPCRRISGTPGAPPGGSRGTPGPQPNWGRPREILEKQWNLIFFDPGAAQSPRKRGKGRKNKLKFISK